MKTIVEDLFTLQRIVLQGGSPSAEQQTQIQQLREKVPAPVLAHFDRLVSRGKNSVAMVRHGVCCECHIRVPVGTLVGLANPKDVAVCDTCGCYLMPAVDEPPVAAEPPPLAPVRKPRKRRAATMAGAVAQAKTP